MKFSSWLLERYLEWQNELKERKSLTEFAAWIGISQPLISNYINGKREPGEDNAYLFFLKFGEEIYQILDIEPPDFLLRYVRASWHLLPDEAKLEIKEIIKTALDAEGVKNSEKIAQPADLEGNSG